jgi:hypothetical protein
MDPILQDVKQEVQQGAAGRRVLKQGAEDVEMSETAMDKEPLKRRRGGAKRKTTAVEESLPRGGRRRRKTKRRRQRARKIRIKRKR